MKYTWLIVLALLGCSEEPRRGELDVLSYNVAGLPEGISSSHPEVNTPLINPLLENYDLVLAQEDFWYHAQLSEGLSHPYQSDPWLDPPDMLNMGDGLNRFSRSPFGELTRTAWPGCNGFTDCASDCLASKGFSHSTHELEEGVMVDIYNLHMEAGGCPEDQEIREESIQLMLDTFDERSHGVAIIIAGDFNLHADEAPELALLEQLVNEGGFEDACWSTGCDDEHIDRIFLRDSDSLDLNAESWAVPGEFVDAEGADLSDHEPVMARISWQTR